MTLLEHIYAVKNLLNSGPSSQSHRFTNRLIAHFLRNSRALLLKRKLDKEKTISQNNYQKFCLRLETADYAQCPDCDIPDFDCNLLRGVARLPSSIKTRWGHTYVIRDILGNIIPPFSLTNNSLKQYSLTQQNNNLGWFESDQHLFVITDKDDLPIVVVEAVLEDPEEVAQMPVCGNGNGPVCIEEYQADRFAIDPELVMPMYEMTLQLLGIGVRNPEDRLLNADNPKMINSVE